MTDRTLPPIAGCAMQTTWDDAHNYLVRLTADDGDFVHLKTAVAAGAIRSHGPRATEGVNWAAKRALAGHVSRALAEEERGLLAQAWWLLSLDPRSKTDMTKGSHAVAVAAALCPGAGLDDVARAWGLLAVAAGPSSAPDPFAAAHAMVHGERTGNSGATDGRGILDFLAYRAAKQLGYAQAKRIVVEAAMEVLDAVEYQGRLRSALNAAASSDDPLVCSPIFERMATRISTVVKAGALFSDEQRAELSRGIAMVAAHRDDAASVRRAAAALTQCADALIGEKPDERRHAQALVCGWSMSARFEWPLGDAMRHPDEADLFKAAHAIAGKLMENLGDARREETNGESETDIGPEDQTDTGSVVVLPHVGGVSTTSAARETMTAFAGIAGVALPRIPTPDLATVRKALRAEFPHLVLQIETILAELAGREFVKLPPLLLISQPGAGKSRFARKLASILDVPLHRFDAAASSDNAFSGTSRRWSSGEPSVPLEAVRCNEVANPIVLVDELDKGGTSLKNGSISAALLPFLETETAARYPDVYAMADCDLSHVSFVATANDERLISAPLRDRFKMLQLPLPSQLHLPELARSIIADIAGGTDARWVPNLSPDECDLAERLWPGGSARKLRAVIERIVARRELRKH